jgi:hypothetical protein
MKSASVDLFDLIKSLNNSEKRYFTLFAQRHYAHNNQYLSLYQILEKQTEYNEDTAIKETGWKKNHYAVQKNILYHQLLNALVQYDTESNPAQKLQQEVFACQKLLQKGLTEQAKTQLRKLQREAQTHELHEISLQLKQLEMALYGRTQYKQVSADMIDEWRQDIAEICGHIEAEAYYKHINARAQKLQLDAGGRNAKVAGEVSKLIQDEGAQRHLGHLTTKAQMDQLQTQALYHFLKEDTLGALQINSSFLKLMESEKHWLQFFPERYFSTLNNYLIDCFVLKKEKELQAGVAKMRALQQLPYFKKIRQLEVNIFRITYQLELNYLIGTGRFIEASKILPLLKDGLTKYADKIPLHHLANLQYLCAYVLFANGSYTEASTMLDALQQNTRSDTPTLIGNVTAIMQVLCHYELSNYSIIDSLVKSCKRKLNSQKPAIASEAEFELLNAILQFAAKPPQVQQWAKAYDRVYQKTTKGKTAYSDYFDFIAYLYARKTKSDFESAKKALLQD